MAKLIFLIFHVSRLLVVACGLLLSSCRGKTEEAADVHQLDPPASMMAALHVMAEHSQALRPNGNLDLYFALLMRENHRAAVAMSALELQRGQDPVLRSIAKDIHRAHQQLIPGLDSAIARIRALPPEFPDHTFQAERLSQLLEAATAGLHPAAHRIIARTEGDNLPPTAPTQHTVENASTGDIDRDYAALLLPHHENSITLARAELELGRDDELIKVAYLILLDQQREIDQVQGWLRQHPAKAK
ncbi:DUF305 domain-containing protein [Hymenobacter sp. DH14]|uniref:DUF305 domain-containing protein n=1 Tax=Hymenobacter cyanobacteriorum TaxID=2926463 RepID=A0A9X2AJG4_9BACT|nr:DUF305 domain-containing protein [Hymenobacter cyanobacteriorum]MCI1189760.1 DUF305 domain-containing protein [Hymenobacter cyanobacteriorum]